MNALLKWSLIFLGVALVAAVFGFAGIVEAAVDIAQVLFFIFIIGFVLLLIIGLVVGSRAAR